MRSHLPPLRGQLEQGTQPGVGLATQRHHLPRLRVQLLQLVEVAQLHLAVLVQSQLKLLVQPSHVLDGLDLPLELLLLLHLDQRVLVDLLADGGLLEEEDAGRLLAEHMHLAHGLLLYDGAAQEAFVGVVVLAGGFAAELELEVGALDGYLVVAVAHHVVGEVPLVLGVQDLHPRAHLHPAPHDHRSLLPARSLRPVPDLHAPRLPHPPLYAGLHALHGPLEVQLAQLLRAPMHAVESGEDLETVGDVALHLRLLPHVDPPEPDHCAVLLHGLLPEAGEEVAVLAGGVVDLHDPDVVGVREEVVVVLGSEGEGGGGDLVDVAAVLVVVLPLLGVAQDLPGLHDLVELVLAGVAVRVLVRVVLQHQLLVLRLELALAGPAGGLQHLVVVDLAVEAELGELDVDVLLVLECSEEEEEEGEGVEDKLGVAALLLVGLQHLLQLLLLLLLLLPLHLLLLFLLLQRLLTLLLPLPLRPLLLLLLTPLLLQSPLQLRPLLLAQLHLRLLLPHRFLLVVQQVFLAEVEGEDLLLLLVQFLCVVLLLLGEQGGPLGVLLGLVEFVVVEPAFVLAGWHDIIIVNWIDRMSHAQRPFVIYSSDNYFYLKSKRPTFPVPSFLKINRLTSKISVLSEERFQEETHKGEKMVREDIYLVMGVLVINQQPYLCIVREVEAVATLNTEKIYCIKKIEYIPFKHKFLYRSINQTENEKVIEGLSDIVIHDNFYFCYGVDITLTYQKLMHKRGTERKFHWNENMSMMFAHYGLPMCWRIPIVQGHVKELYCENNYFSFYYCLISRRSKFMSGTRFNSRGIDMNCNSSNFVETEEIFICHNYLFSHISLRGSAPIYWQQEEFGAPITFSHTDEDNMLVLEKHYEFLKKEYQSNIITINLLSNKKSPEKELKNRFQYYIYKAMPNEPYLFYDLNEEIKEKENSSKIIDAFVQANLAHFSPPENFLCIDRYTNKIYRQQSIISRINCLDCIDRTNVIMSRISAVFMDQVMNYINSHTNMEEKKLHLNKEYLQTLIEVWVELGNRISMIYCGTESIASHLIKQEETSFFSFFTGGMKSINRYYNANVNDGFKQTCIDFLLGQKEELSKTKYFDDNITKNVLQEVKYCSYEEAVLFILTWNCNTVDPEKLSQKDKEKLFNFPVDKTDILVICLQEMVELNSFNVLIGSNDKIVQHWRKMIEAYLNEITANSNKVYVYLSCYDMVGIATLVFISGALYNRVYMHEWKEIKTGFKNNLGNKGSIALFLQIDSSYLTIMNCHLAAGENASGERQQDIQYIHNDALNQRDKRRLFDKSEYRFFIGDMNFRLQAKNEHVREILYTIEKMDAQRKLTKSDMQTYLQTLLQKDEYYLNNKTGVLSVYRQGNIYFLPTYKYVKREKIYDTKRTPSWCDRILFYSHDEKKIVILKYWDVDCYQSDHKPVTGAFKILLKKEDADRKNKLMQIYMEKIE